MTKETFYFLRYHLVLAFLLLGNHEIFSQSIKPEWFPQRCLYPSLEYDLLEVQTYTGIMFLNAGNVKYEGVYIPVNLGFRKSILQWEMLNMNFDLALGAASYTQFEIIRYDNTTLRGGLLNTDFKASGFLFASKDMHKFRLQLFHVSSHLGDDYILRNQDFDYNDKSVNYEQIDVTYLITIRSSDLYFGLGEVITPNNFRDRFMIQTGFQGFHSLKPKSDLTFGADIKFYEENGFAPDIHGGGGITWKQRDERQINLSIDAYYGYMPYSTLDFGKVSWIGLSSRIYL